MTDQLPQLLADEIDSYGQAIIERDHARDVACTLEQELAAAEAQLRTYRSAWERVGELRDAEAVTPELLDRIDAWIREQL